VQRSDERLKELLLETLRARSSERGEPPTQRRGELLAQLERLRDLYLMSDLVKAQ